MAETTPETSLLYGADGRINPNLIQMLAGIGAEMDPKGAGGILGRAAIGFSRREQRGALAAKMLAGGEAERKELREMNQRLLDRLGPATLPGTPGLNSYKENSNGSLSLNIDTGNPEKFVADLGGYSPAGMPGVTSLTRDRSGAYIFDVDAPELPKQMSVAEEVDNFAPGNLYQATRGNQPLSYAPINPQERMNEMADLMEVNMPPSLAASMRTPQVQRVSSPAQQTAQMQADIAELAPSYPTSPNDRLPRRSLRRS